MDFFDDYASTARFRNTRHHVLQQSFAYSYYSLKWESITAYYH